MRAECAQRDKHKAADSGETSMERLLIVIYPIKITGRGKAAAGLIVRSGSGTSLVRWRHAPDPLPEGGYFTQFCLAVMTYQIKAFLLTSTSLNGHTRRPASISVCAITLFTSATPWPCTAACTTMALWLKIGPCCTLMLQPQLARIGQPVAA